MCDYTKLDSISIDECDLILKYYGSIYNMCLRRNIKSLGELLRKYDKGELALYDYRAKEEMLGFIDLIKYHYLGVGLCEGELLFDNIIYSDNINTDEYRGYRYKTTTFDNNYFINPLKRLGFSSSEVRAILRFVEDKENSMMIIVALLMYKDVKRKWTPCKYKGCLEIFEKKLDIILKYFKEYYIEKDKDLDKSICDNILSLRK